MYQPYPQSSRTPSTTSSYPSSATPPPSTHLQHNPKYQLLRQRGYSDAQIQALLNQHTHQQHPYTSPSSVPDSHHQYQYQHHQQQPHPHQQSQHHQHHQYQHQHPHQPPQQNQPHQPSTVPLPPPPSIEQSTMFRYTEAADARRYESIPSQYQRAPHDVVPRAGIQLQTKPDKSTMEAVYQDIYQSRMVDVPVVQRRQREGTEAGHYHQPQQQQQQQQQPQYNPSLPQYQPPQPQPQYNPPQPQHQSPQPQHQPPPSQPQPQQHTQPSPTKPRPSTSSPSSSTSSSSSTTNTTPPPHARRRAFEAELQRLRQDEATAFKLLNIPRKYDLKMLAKQYRKAALKYHPDRLSASQQEAYAGMFEQVTKAYLLLMERYTQQDENRPFYELRKQSREAIQKQSPPTEHNEHTTHTNSSSSTSSTSSTTAPLRLGKGDQFNRDLFNKIYDEHRLHAPTDEGYGDWMTSNDTPEFDPDDPPKLFTQKFNTEVFNTTFQQLKRDDPNAERQLVVRDEMGMVVHGNSTPYSTLGEGDIGDFGGTTHSLQYSDLKSAHTTHATLIDASRIAKQGPTFRSVKELEAHRSQLSTEPSAEEVERAARIQARAEAEEAARRERVRARDALGVEVMGRIGC